MIVVNGLEFTIVYCKQDDKVDGRFTQQAKRIMKAMQTTFTSPEKKNKDDQKQLKLQGE